MMFSLSLSNRARLELQRLINELIERKLIDNCFDGEIIISVVSSEMIQHWLDPHSYMSAFAAFPAVNKDYSGYSDLVGVKKQLNDVSSFFTIHSKSYDKMIN